MKSLVNEIRHGHRFRVYSVTRGGVMRYRILPEGGFQGTISPQWLMANAYEVMPVTRIVGGPSWARTHVFNVDARPSGKATLAETRAMLRTLIEERFGLVWRRDPNGKATVYTLVLARDARRLGGQQSGVK